MRLLAIIILSLSNFPLFAQEDQVALPESPLDTLALDSIKNSQLSKLDSSKSKWNNKLDALKTSKDSLNLDSLKAPVSFNKLDSAKGEVTSKINSLESVDDQLTGGLDSLTGIGSRLVGKLDSLSVTDSLAAKKGKLTSTVTESKEKIKEKTAGATEFSQKLSETTGAPNVNAGLPEGDELGLPGMEVGEVELPDVENPLGSTDLPAIEGDVPEIDLPQVDTDISVTENLQNLDTDKLGNIETIDNVSDQSGGVKEVTGGVSEYSGQLNELKEKGVLEKGGELLENEAGNLEGMSELQSQSAELAIPGEESIPIDVEALKDQESLKEEALRIGEKQVFEHLTNHDEKVKTAMLTMSKFKKKYHNLPSIRELPDKRPNPLEGEPLIHRILPGFVMEVLRDGYTNIDIGPSLGYRFDDRWRLYGSYHYRFYYDDKAENLVQPGPVYGPRLSGMFIFYKGFFATSVLEMMRSDTREIITAPSESRKWFYGAYLGVGKEFDFTQKVKGNVQFAYNFLHDDHGPYLRQFNIRFGFDFRLKETKKKQQKRLENETAK